MNVLYISLAFVLVLFGASCFNMGQRRGYRVVLKSLLKGQIHFLSQKTQTLRDNRGGLSRQEFDKAYYAYETIGQLVAGWYRYFSGMRSDRELKDLKAQIKKELEEYLELLESIGEARNFQIDGR
jgi:hypothetical protein